VEAVVFALRKHTETLRSFLPARRYAIARVLAMALCPAVSVSIASRRSVETVERIRLVFGTGASFHLSYDVL